YFTRHEVIETALLHGGWSPASFVIVPADINDLRTVSAFLPSPASSVVYATIYDHWGEEKVRRLSELGFAVEVLWRRAMSERATSGAEVRELMRRGQPWQDLVPPGASGFLASYLTAHPLS